MHYVVAETVTSLFKILVKLNFVLKLLCFIFLDLKIILSY